MNELIEKIHKLKRFKYEYYLLNPSHSNEDYSKKFQELVNQLVQEIPISIGSGALHSYYLGKIYNLNINFDPRAEENLNQAIRCDPENVDAWLELGLCCWNKMDIKKTYTCFKEALNRERTAKTLCYMAAGIRSLLSINSCEGVNDNRSKLLKIQECLELCKEAIKLQPNYSYAWHSLGNCYIYRFFASFQIQQKDLILAMDAFKKCLTITSPFEYLNADLHFNFCVALQYKQSYEEAIKNCKRALALDPHFPEAKKTMEYLQNYLIQFQEGIQRKNKIPKRQIKDLVQLKNDRKFQEILIEKFASQNEQQKKSISFSNLNDLKEGENLDKFVVLKVIGVVNNDEKTPYTLICADSEWTTIGVTIYNFSEKFSSIISDVLSIINPYLIRIQNLEINGKMINFKTLRILDPLNMAKNGRLIASDNRAYMNMSINTRTNNNNIKNF